MSKNFRYYETDPEHPGLRKQPPRKKRKWAGLPEKAVETKLYASYRDSQDDNAGIDSAELAQKAAEKGIDRLSTVHRPGRQSEKEARPNHQRQKKAIRKQYAAAKHKADRTASGMTDYAGKTAKTVEEKARKTGETLWKHRKGTAVFLLLALLLLFLLNAVSSCTVMLQGIGSALTGSTYPSSDEAMLGAEAAYAQMEAQLRDRLDRYEAEHDYEEVRYELDEIWHDPYVLVSLLTAYREGEWTLEEVGPTMQMLFDRQYILQEEVQTETHYRTETRTGYRMVYDPVTGESHRERYQYEVQIPYTTETCTVHLENFNLSHLPIYVMGERQLSLYAMYISTQGNRPDLFPQSQFPHASVQKTYLDYEVPASVLKDKKFAKMLKEAEKYLGYPYIWGGYCPATSFDCSGFISWVINHSGWNYGRLGVDGLLAQCRVVSEQQARPGDLVFFQGTLDEPGATHVGLYVGNGMMIHCGSPISYADLRTPYWQEHAYCYGRLP